VPRQLPSLVGDISVHAIDVAEGVLRPYRIRPGWQVECEKLPARRHCRDKYDAGIVNNLHCDTVERSTRGVVTYAPHEAAGVDG